MSRRIRNLKDKDRSKRTMIKISAAILSTGALIFLIVNSGIHGDLAEQNTKSFAIPGDFEVRGTCNPRTYGSYLEGIRATHETVDLGMFVKHGLHMTRNHFPEECTSLDRHELIASGTGINAEEAWHPTWTVNEFIDSPRQHKILAVRDPASFYKSVFNHVCNKMTEFKIKWREENDIDCSRKREFHKLMEWARTEGEGTANDRLQELSRKHDPYLLKKIVMKSPKVRSIMLVDYTCIPEVINTLCGGPTLRPGEIGAKSNSASAQDYTDYWTLHNLEPPWTQYIHFWNNISDALREECCIELVKNF